MRKCTRIYSAATRPRSHPSLAVAYGGAEVVLLGLSIAELGTYGLSDRSLCQDLTELSCGSIGTMGMRGSSRGHVKKIPSNRYKRQSWRIKPFRPLPERILALPDEAGRSPYASRDRAITLDTGIRASNKNFDQNRQATGSELPEEPEHAVRGNSRGCARYLPGLFGVCSPYVGGP